MTKKTRFKIEKLVRDLVPQIIESYGIRASVRRLNDSEYIQCLKDKLLEEAKEVMMATNKSEIKEELADVLEVLIAIGTMLGISSDEIEKTRADKKINKGGFENRIYSSYIEMDATNPKLNDYLSQPDKYPEWKINSPSPNSTDFRQKIICNEEWAKDFLSILRKIPQRH